MPKHNEVRLKGPVIKVTLEDREDGTQEIKVVMGVIRGYRNVGDGREKVKIDHPIIMSRNKDMIYEMATWSRNDIVEVKGAITSRTLNKQSICPFCKQINVTEGLSVYIEPIFVEKIFKLENDAASIQYLNTIREVSNEAKVFGNLCRDPKKVKIKNGPTVTQYPLAVPRKYTIREDPPSVDTDFPWVKVYGQNAIDDRNRLKINSTVFIDGLIQTRSINRKADCQFCSKRYEWKDRALELIPYETEYISNYYTEDEAVENEKKRKEQRLKSLGLDKFMFNPNSMEYDDYDNDDITDADVEAGIDTMKDVEE